MSGPLLSPSLVGELAALSDRLDRLERPAGRGARDEPCPMTSYPFWPGGSVFSRIFEFPIGGVNNPVIRAEFWYQLGGTGVVEFRLRDFSSNAVTSAYSAGIGGNHRLRCDWLHPMGDGFTRQSTTWRRVEIQARIASGSPTLYAWPGIATGTQLSVSPNANVNGLFTIDP